MRTLCPAVVLTLLTAALSPAAGPATAPATRPADVTVLDPAGRPVRAATVVVVPITPKLDQFYVYDGTIRPWLASGYRQWRTDSAGRCEVVVPTGPAWVLAMHESGWAQVRPPADGVVRLDPWAGVRGRATVGGKPAAGWTVVVRRITGLPPGDRDRVLSMPAATVAADGTFSIDRVPPGEVQVGLTIDANGKPAPGGMIRLPQLFDVAAGRTIDVTLGGGRTVEGTIALPAGLSTKGLTPVLMLKHAVDLPKRPMPPDVANGTAERRATWRAAFEASADYPAYQRAVGRAMARMAWVPATLKDGTSFRVTDVPPGDYTTQFEYRDAEGRPVLRADTAAVAVPAGGADAVTVPAVTMRRVARAAKAGEPAPDFAVTSLDGRPVKLSDYRGRFVLVDFWATWCGPCLAENPNLRRTHDAFTPTGKFVLLSVSYDKKAETAKAYVTAQKIPWDQAWVGDPFDETIGESYPGGLPTIVLVGPDGTVIATDLRGEGIHAAVEKAMRSPKEQVPSPGTPGEG